jgi:hypothetical protein
VEDLLCRCCCCCCCCCCGSVTAVTCGVPLAPALPGPCTSCWLGLAAGPASTPEGAAGLGGVGSRGTRSAALVLRDGRAAGALSAAVAAAAAVTPPPPAAAGAAAAASLPVPGVLLPCTGAVLAGGCRGEAAS